MKKYTAIILSMVLSVILGFNVFLLINKNSDINKNTSNTITEIIRCIENTKECLQKLINSKDSANQNNMMYVINGQFSALYHLCHANRNIYNEACSDFEYMGATFVGNAGTYYFITNGIYEDSEITENEYAYIKELIDLLDKACQNIHGNNAKRDLNALNSNFKEMHKQLRDEIHSPYRLIKSQN